MWLLEITLSLCVSYSYLTRVILFGLSGETESNNYMSFTKSLSTTSSPSPRKNPSHFLCYSASSSYLPPAVLLPSQWILLPKLLYACSLSLSKPPQKLITCRTHTDQTRWIFFWTSGSQMLHPAALQSEHAWILPDFLACVRTVSDALHFVTSLPVVLLQKDGKFL